MNVKNLIPFLFMSLVTTAVAIAIMSRVPAVWNIVKKPGA